MSSFCPTCGNSLHIKQTQGSAFYCRTCPYIYKITTHVTFPLQLKRKKVDDVLGGAGAWDNVDKTKGRLLIPMIKLSANCSQCFSFRSVLTTCCFFRSFYYLSWLFPSLFIFSLLATCPKCGNDEAFFMQIQTRSADEVSSSTLYAYSLWLSLFTPHRCSTSLLPFHFTQLIPYFHSSFSHFIPLYSL